MYCPDRFARRLSQITQERLLVFHEKYPKFFPGAIKEIILGFNVSPPRKNHSPQLFSSRTRFESFESFKKLNAQIEIFRTFIGSKKKSESHQKSELNFLMFILQNLEDVLHKRKQHFYLFDSAALLEKRLVLQADVKQFMSSDSGPCVNLARLDSMILLSSGIDEGIWHKRDFPEIAALLYQDHQIALVMLRYQILTVIEENFSEESEYCQYKNRITARFGMPHGICSYVNDFMVASVKGELSLFEEFVAWLDFVDCCGLPVIHDWREYIMAKKGFADLKSTCDGKRQATSV